MVQARRSPKVSTRAHGPGKDRHRGGKES